MKKNILLALLVLLSLGISTMLDAQTGKKKKKKKKHTTTQVVDTVAAVPPPDTAKVVVAPADDDTGHSFTKGLVADTSYLAYTDFGIDSSRPVDGFL